VQALDEKDRKENNPPEGHTSRSTNPPHLSARSRPIDKKKNAEKVNKKEKRCFGSECEIRGRGVRSRTTAGASSSDS